SAFTGKCKRGCGNVDRKGVSNGRRKGREKRDQHCLSTGFRGCRPRGKSDNHNAEASICADALIETRARRNRGSALAKPFGDIRPRRRTPKRRGLGLESILVRNKQGIYEKN